MEQEHHAMATNEKGMVYSVSDIGHAEMTQIFRERTLAPELATGRVRPTGGPDWRFPAEAIC